MADTDTMKELGLLFFPVKHGRVRKRIDAIESISERFSQAERRGRAKDGMSRLRCDNCGRVIATDAEPESFDEVANRWFCRPCREVPVRDLTLAEAWLARWQGQP